VPTEAKAHDIAELADLFGKAKVAIATDFSGLSVNQMTDLRRRLREQGADFRVVKNRIALRAAREAGSDLAPELLAGVTGIAFGYDDPVAVAKVLGDYVKETRSLLKIRNGVVSGELYAPAQIVALANVPARDVLLGRLVSQLNSPIVRLVWALNSSVQGLATVLHRRAEQLGSAG